MKISKLTITAILAAGLALTGCNTNSKGSSSSASETPSSSSQAQKVATRVAVKKVNSVVVGDQLDLDTIVDVIYDDGSKDKEYTVEVQASSSELVSVSGKTVTFLKEGEPKITLKAGSKEGLFSTYAVSKLKKDATEAFANVTNNLGAQVSTDGTNFIQRVIHRPNYTYMPSWPSGGLQNGSGLMKFATGRGYSYSVTGGAISVGEQVEYDNYFVTMDVDFAISETVTLQDETGTDYLHLSSSVPSAWSQYGYYSHVHFLMTVLTGLNFSDPYYDNNDQYLNPAAGTEYTRWESMNIYGVEDEQGQHFFFNVTAADYTVAEHEDPTSTYQYEGENDEMVPGSEELSMIMIITPYAEDEVVFQALEAFVADPANEPVSKDFTKVKDFFANSVDGTPHNFSAIAQTAFTNKTDSYDHDVFVETYKANEDVYDISVAVTDHGEDTFGLADKSRATGFAVKEGALYQYDRGTGVAQAVAGKTSIYGDAQVKANTFASLSSAGLWTNFYVSSVTLNEESHYEVYALNASRSVDFIKAILGQTDAGYYYLNLATSIANAGYWYTSLDEAIGYGGYARIILFLDDTNTNVVAVQFQYYAFLCYYGDTGQTWINSAIQLSNIGSTPAVDLSGIDFPTE